jgi:hypothetical protein
MLRPCTKFSVKLAGVREISMAGALLPESPLLLPPPPPPQLASTAKTSPRAAHFRIFTVRPLLFQGFPPPSGKLEE